MVEESCHGDESPEGLGKATTMSFSFNAAEAKAKLESIIHQNLQGSVNVVERAMSEVIEDKIVRAPALVFDVKRPAEKAPRAVEMAMGGGSAMVVHPHA